MYILIRKIVREKFPETLPNYRKRSHLLIKIGEIF